LSSDLPVAELNSCRDGQQMNDSQSCCVFIGHLHGARYRLLNARRKIGCDQNST